MIRSDLTGKGINRPALLLTILTGRNMVEPGGKGSVFISTWMRCLVGDSNRVEAHSPVSLKPFLAGVILLPVDSLNPGSFAHKREEQDLKKGETVRLS